MKKPIPSFEWIVTLKCNYKCPYCYQQNKSKKHCSNETVDAVFNYLPTLKEAWLVKLIGGEPMIHPRFFEICEHIVDNGHNMCMTTNLSMPLEKLGKMVEICKNQLEYITASLHISQIQDIEKFVEKAFEFRKMLQQSTEFTITSVVTQDNFDKLKKVEEQCSKNDLKFRYQIMKDKNGYAQYPKIIETHIADKLISNTKILRNQSFRGTFCHTGELFFKIDVNGNVTRCYNMQPFFLMGNITKGNFQRFINTKPCLSGRCTCTVPANRYMIHYGNKVTKFVILKETFSGLLHNIKIKCFK